MTEFESRLSECLEALREGRWDLEGCLARHRQHAAALRPHLLAAIAAMQAFDVQPREEFAQAARERFLIASGQRLQEALDVDPEPTFFAAARVRFLMAAQRMKLGQKDRRQPRHVPVFGTPTRALAGGLAALAIFLGFSTYTVRSADAALPGDWNYGIKLQTENVRLALAFNDGSRRGVRLDIAEERVTEIEQLTKKGKIIGSGVLDRLVEQTQPLVDDVQSNDWGTEDAQRLHDVAIKEKQVLAGARASAQVDPEARPKLAEAEGVTLAAVETTTRLIVAAPDGPPLVLTPPIVLTPTPASIPPSTPAPSPTAGAANVTPLPPDTPTAAPSTPEPLPTASDSVEISGGASVTRNSVKLYALTAGRIRVLIPGSADGWFPSNLRASGVPVLLNISNAIDAPSAAGSSLIALNTLNGDMYWYYNHDGKVDEVQMRITGADGVRIADRDVLRAAYGDAANVPVYVMESIQLLPDSTPAPDAIPSPAPTRTATP